MNCKLELKFLKVVIAPQIYVPINHIGIIVLVIQPLDLTPCRLRVVRPAGVTPKFVGCRSAKSVFGSRITNWMKLYSISDAVKRDLLFHEAPHPAREKYDMLMRRASCLLFRLLVQVHCWYEAALKEVYNSSLCLNITEIACLLETLHCHLPGSCSLVFSQGEYLLNIVLAINMIQKIYILNIFKYIRIQYAVEGANKIWIWYDTAKVYSNIFEYGAVAVFHSDLPTPQPLELKSHQQASKSMIRPPGNCQVSTAPYRICSPLDLPRSSFCDLKWVQLFGSSLTDRKEPESWIVPLECPHNSTIDSPRLWLNFAPKVRSWIYSDIFKIY
jgi:hypothetical protein